MAQDDTHDAGELTETREDGARNRSALTWSVAAVTLLVIVSAVIWALTRDSEDDGTDAPGSDSRGVADNGPPTVTTLVLAEPALSGRCINPVANPQALRGAQVAFEGTVTGIDGTEVTLEPSEFYQGEETDLVEVQQSSEELSELLGAVRFEDGGTYLVAATDGRVMLCGFSAEYSEGLAGAYAEAFGG